MDESSKLKVPITEDVWYELSSTDRVRELDHFLVAEIDELSNELEENHLVHGLSKTVSSVPIPRNTAHFKKEREVCMQRALEVCEAKPVMVQTNAMEKEWQTVLASDYSVEGMALLLHQFFVDRMHQLVQCKHLHMLRWRRFCEHTSSIEELYPYYQERLQQIMTEYSDCQQRADRLSGARELCLADKTGDAVTAVKQDDMLIYLRWLISHFHSLKKFNQYMRVLQWLPTQYKFKLAAEKNANDDDSGEMVKIPEKYQTAFSFEAGLSEASSSSREMSIASAKVIKTKESLPMAAPPFNTQLQSTVAMPSSQLAIMTAATGGGLVGDEIDLNIPVASTEFTYIKPLLIYLTHVYDIDINVETIDNTSDEMELFAVVNRKFKMIFTRQEHMKIFKTYDTLEAAHENWGSQHSIHTLKREANWLPYVKVKPDRDPHMEKKLTELRRKNNVDELLRVMSKFVTVKQAERVQETLRSHSSALKDPQAFMPVSSRSKNKTQHSTPCVWKQIYTNPELYNDGDKDPLDKVLEELGEKSAKPVFDKNIRKSSFQKRKHSYDYVETMQLLGLDEGIKGSNDPSSIEGGYVSFLQLRHLRIRDLQRTALSLLNYFRSIERTLTINDGGLSQDLDGVKPTSEQNHRKSVQDGVSLGGGGGLGSHYYSHNTPADYKVSETEFLQFGDIDNHDDFYVLEEGRVHVKEQRGFYILYDAALDDLKSLEKDLLLICTHFIEKDKDFRSNKCDSARRKRAQSQAGDFDIPSYSHRDIDRFGILMDIWAQTVAFLECKKELLDCYFEAYQHIFDRDEKRAMAQGIVNLMYRKPRIDFTANYFVRCYRLECICLRMQAELVKSILDSQIEKEREYAQRVCREDSNQHFGLPFPVIPKQPISVNMSRSALRNVYMLEFHPSLAAANRLPEGFKHAYWELYHIHKPETVTDAIILEKNMMEAALKEWHELPPLGNGYSQQVKRDLFSEAFVEDPMFVTEVTLTLIEKEEQKALRKTQKEKVKDLVQTMCKVFDAMTLRHRLIDSAWECEVLSNIYRTQAVEMGYDECHLFLRSIQFEIATKTKGEVKAPPLFITAIQEDDSSVDRLVPKNLCLAIQELDESHVGMFSFQNRDKILRLLKGSGPENLKTVFMAQLMHRNALMAAVQQAAACQPVKERYSRRRSSSPVDTKSEKSSATAMTGVSTATGATPAGIRPKASTNKMAPEAFVSLQLEKVPSRDKMLNEFVNKKSTLGSILQNQDKMGEVKRKLINEFCMSFHQRVAQYSLRSQIIAYYNSLLGLLDDFPNVRDTYFMLGDPNEKKTNFDSLDGLQPDARTLHKRPRRVLSEDGDYLLNIWFIPHYTEALRMYKMQTDEDCKRALTSHLRIVSSLHDIVQYLCAHSRLGSSVARLGSKKIDFVSADWGGNEGIGADLREIQTQIDHLQSSSSPEAVAEFLSMRRDVMFLEFDAAVRHSMTGTFLATGNKHAYDAVSDCMQHALHELSNAQRASFDAVCLNVPEPLEARDLKAQQLYPWRAFINREGPYPIMFWQWSQIEYYMQMCLAGLKDVDKHVANAEILGVSLLMEDVLLSGEQDKAIFDPNDQGADPFDTASNGDSRPTSGKPTSTSGSRPTSGKLSNTQASRPNSTSEDARPASGKPTTRNKMMRGSVLVNNTERLSKTTQPMLSYRLLKMFLMLWKKLEFFKQHWGKTRLAVENINTPSLYNKFCREYKKDVLYPVLENVSRRYGQGELYEGMASLDEPIVMPKGVSEMEVQARQMLKLLEHTEILMISEIRKKIQRSLSLALTERAREETALQTDLWKKPTIRERFTILKPHIAEQFIDKLMTKVEETDDKFTFKKEHLNECLNTLASEVMVRERSNYQNYSIFYENLLHANNQSLYQKEQEVKLVRDQLESLRDNITTEVQCQLADTTQDLLVEVTALRAKVAEMREQTLTQEGEIRGKVREEYDALVHNLFAACFDIKRKFDEFREEFHDDVFEKITEVRREAMANRLTAARDQEGAELSRSDASLSKEKETNERDEARARELARAERMRTMQQDNHFLELLLMKVKTMTTWKLHRARGVNEKLINKYRGNSEQSKKALLEANILAEEKILLLQQQLVALRQCLNLAETKCLDLSKDLEKEKKAKLKAKREKTHAAQQKAQSQKQLEEARRANIDKLIDDLEEKEKKLLELSSQYDKNKKMQLMMTEKSKKDKTQIKKQLNHERNLKLDAFTRVDELQTSVYDLEGIVGSYGFSPLPTTSPPQHTKKTRPQTASATVQSRSRPYAKYTNRIQTPLEDSPMSWPPAAPWPANRSPSPTSECPQNNAVELPKKIQRPKTSTYKTSTVSTARLRSRIAEQLINQLEPPDHHETILKLKEMQELKKEKNLF